ncbi:MAG: N-6 DNA methylase [Verrucomicrobiia bacterium]
MAEERSIYLGEIVQRAPTLLHEADGYVNYVVQKKRYKANDPEEAVRVAFYLELVEKYRYKPQRLDLEVEVPRRTPKDRADIVVYTDEDQPKPFIVVECKRDGISEAELEQAIKQCWGNANNLRAKYAILVAGKTRVAFLPAEFDPRHREQAVIADIPINYGKVPRYLYKKGDPQWDLQPVTERELESRFQICHDILWAGGRRNPAEAFDEMSKLLFCKLQDERTLTDRGQHYAFQTGTHEQPEDVAKRIHGIYAQAREFAPEVFQSDLKATPAEIYRIAEVLRAISLNETNLDVKGQAFEKFLGAVFRGEMGQYFTPRPIVKFVVDFLQPVRADKVIDPACGSGGFLLHALEEIRAYARAHQTGSAQHQYWFDWALRNVHGIEINEQISRVAMMGMIIHEDGHSNIRCADALDTYDNLDIDVYGSDSFTLVVTNPPFGAEIARSGKGHDHPYLDTYDLGGKTKKRDRQKSEILFIERCLDLLKAGGRMGIVVPDGILTNSSLQYVRDFITQHAQVLAVVSLPQTAFAKAGAGVKASLLFLRKWDKTDDPDADYPIFMAIAEHIGCDATGRPDSNDLIGTDKNGQKVRESILEQWEKFKNSKSVGDSNASNVFVIRKTSVTSRFDPFYFKPEFVALEKQLQHGARLGDVLDSIDYGLMPMQDYAEDATAGVPFIRVTNVTSDGEIDMHDVKYIPKDDANIDKKRVRKDDVLLVQCGSTTGKAAIVPAELEGYVAPSFCLVLRPSAKLRPKYLFTFLQTDLGYKQVLRSCNFSTVRPNTTKPDVERLRIPLPSVERQDAIAGEMERASARKREMEAQAQALLDSIDGYVLEHLSVALPQLSDEKTFSVRAKNVRGSRLDPFFNHPRHAQIGTAMRKSRFDKAILGDVLREELAGGATPTAKGEAYTTREDGGIPFLRIQNVNADGISFDDMNYIRREVHEADLRRSQLAANDVVMTITGRVGTAAVVPETLGDANINQHNVRIRLGERCEPQYLADYLNTKLGFELSNRRVSGGSRFAVDYEAIRQILVILPPMDVQRRIASEVRQRREHAKRLRDEANKLLADARVKVETMILDAA